MSAEKSTVPQNGNDSLKAKLKALLQGNRLNFSPRELQLLHDAQVNLKMQQSKWFLDNPLRYYSLWDAKEFSLAIQQHWQVLCPFITPSTQDCCLELPRCVALADWQTAGRGQHGRKWLSAFSQQILLTCTLPNSSYYSSRIFIAQAILAVRSVFQVPVFYKWPNDIYTAQGKVGGLLAQKYFWGWKVGLGLNCTAAPTEHSAVLCSVANSKQRRDYVEQLLTRFGLRNWSDSSVAKLLNTLSYFQRGQQLLLCTAQQQSYWVRFEGYGQQGELLYRATRGAPVQACQHAQIKSWV